MHALGVDVAGGDVLHDRRRAAALGVDEEVGARVLGAGARDVAGPDPGVDVALAVPDVQRAPDRLLDVGAEEHVRAEEDLGVRAVLAQDVLDDADGVGRGHAVVGERLDLGRRVDVHDRHRAGCLACQARSCSAVIESASEQPASRSGISTVLSGLRIDAVSAMKCTPQKAIVDAAAENLRFPPLGSSMEGESGPKARPKSVVDGKQVNIPVLFFVGTEGRRKLS